MRPRNQHGTHLVQPYPPTTGDLNPPGPPRPSDLIDRDDPAFSRILRAAVAAQTRGDTGTPEELVLAAIAEGRAAHIKAKTPTRSGPTHEDDQRKIPRVYYMRIGNRVKIGYTTNLRGRLASLNPEELMTFEYGGIDRERARHQEFARLRTHGEWFRYESPLVEHIAAIQAAST